MSKSDNKLLAVFKDLTLEKDDKEEVIEKKEAALVLLTTLADKAERYDDMCTFLVQVINSRSDRDKALTDAEMNMLSVCYKNVVGAMRQSWRTLNGEKETDTKESAAKLLKLVTKELEDKCDEIIGILEKKLIPVCKKLGQKQKENEKEKKSDDEKTDYVHQEVFYLKMAGDYHRYMCELESENKDKQAKAKEFYTSAIELANKHLPETNPTRLGLALNASVCYYEICKDSEKACKLAKQAFDDAIQKLDTLNDANYKDSTLIMQLLRDNLTLWNAEAPNEQQED